MTANQVVILKMTTQVIVIFESCESACVLSTCLRAVKVFRVCKTCCLKSIRVCQMVFKLVWMADRDSCFLIAFILNDILMIFQLVRGLVLDIVDNAAGLNI